MGVGTGRIQKGVIAVVGCCGLYWEEAGKPREGFEQGWHELSYTFSFTTYFNLTDSVCCVENSGVAQGSVETGQEMRPPLRRSWLPGGAGVAPGWPEWWQARASGGVERALT